MPVPPLPLELIALVCEHLETPVWSPHEPVPDGLSMALTCRAWKGLGYRLMLRRTEIFLTMHPTGRGNRLARLLLEKPSLCSYIEELKLRTGLFEYAGLDDASEEEFVHRLLSQTSSIRLLRLSPPSRRTPQYLQALPPTVFSDPLRTLHLDCAGFRPSAIDRVLDTLARLPRLDSLCLSPSKPGVPWDDRSPDLSTTKMSRHTACPPRDQLRSRRLRRLARAIYRHGCPRCHPYRIGPLLVPCLRRRRLPVLPEDDHGMQRRPPSSHRVVATSLRMPSRHQNRRILEDPGGHQYSQTPPSPEHRATA